MDIAALKRIVEGALLAAGHPLSLNQLNSLFPDGEQPGHGPLREALAALDIELEDRAVELKEVGSGYRLQIRTPLMPIISKLWTDKPPRYSRALLETLAIIAYRQPITRGDIEQIRGVSASSSILRTLQERGWVRVVGHRDVPGRPELLGTSRAFLDYFNLKSLDELPTLAEIKDIDNLEPELELKLRSPESEPAPPSSQSDIHDQADQRQADERPAGQKDDAQEDGPFRQEEIDPVEAPAGQDATQATRREENGRQTQAGRQEADRQSEDDGQAAG